ncbi:type II secretion system F family protein [Candidatus Gracilibacteria bacterium]|nr:type II secretion system F family protein [Candidatus Gracilibacteria bacterium]
MKNINIPVFQKVSLIEKFNFYEYLSVMLDGGVTISETLDSVQTKIKKPFFKEKIRELQTYVSSGDSFSKSMKKIPQIFTSGEVSIVESGETTGKLSLSLANLSENLRKNHDLRSKIKAALTYPAIIFLFLVLAIIIVLTYVIPAVSQLFETSEVELPGATKALIATSNFVIYNWPLLLLFLATATLLFYGYKNTEKGRANLDYFILSLPLVGKVYKNYILASLSTNLGSLVSSGVPVVKSLSLTAKSLDNLVYETHLLEVMQKVSGGQKIVDSMQEVDEDHNIFPLDFLQMLSVGEKTASLDKVTKKLTDQYTREVNYSLGNLTKWIEPIAILIAGVFVLWFAFAIFGAILKVTQTVS